MQVAMLIFGVHGNNHLLQPWQAGRAVVIGVHITSRPVKNRLQSPQLLGQGRGKRKGWEQAFSGRVS